MWPFAKSKPKHAAARVKFIRAKYDSAQTNVDNVRHWANADALSADAAASSSVRNTLRIRSRYEVANNTYAKGIILTLANDCIGTGPRLQMLTDNADLNRTIESAFATWSGAVDLAAKLRTMRMAKATDGETFAVLTANGKLKSPVTLDVRLIEADRVTNPALRLASDADTDGIILDQWGNPRHYAVLRNHPGAAMFTTNIGEYDWIPAESIIHWFRPDRAGQHRGVPEITPALPLFAQLRRYTLATLAAAETAAEFAAVLYTDSPANEQAASVEAMEVIELERRMATVLPDGWKLGQIKAEQPTTTYAEFVDKILNAIARCLNMPFNVAAGNSAGYNYASGRLDHQVYFKAIRIEQYHMGLVVLDRILQAWVDEAMLTNELSALRRLRGLPHKWFWDGTEHVDPAKEANAQSTRLASNTTTLAAEYAKAGLDWENELEQRSRELNRMRELGIPLPGSGSQANDTQDDTDEEEADDEEEVVENRSQR